MLQIGIEGFEGFSRDMRGCMCCKLIVGWTSCVIPLSVTQLCSKRLEDVDALFGSSR